MYFLAGMGFRVLCFSRMGFSSWPILFFGSKKSKRERENIVVCFGLLLLLITIVVVNFYFGVFFTSLLVLEKRLRGFDVRTLNE